MTTKYLNFYVSTLHPGDSKQAIAQTKGGTRVSVTAASDFSTKIPGTWHFGMVVVVIVVVVTVRVAKNQIMNFDFLVLSDISNTFSACKHAASG